MGTEADNRMASNESLFTLIRSMSPERLAFARIACAWDDLNSQYSRNGCDAEFADKRRRLKRLIGSQIDRGAITRDSLAEWMSLPWHQDVVYGLHGVAHMCCVVLSIAFPSAIFFLYFLLHLGSVQM